VEKGDAGGEGRKGTLPFESEKRKGTLPFIPHVQACPAAETARNAQTVFQAS